MRHNSASSDAVVSVIGNSTMVMKPSLFPQEGQRGEDAGEDQAAREFRSKPAILCLKSLP
jgi:hypothetical protein